MSKPDDPSGKLPDNVVLLAAHRPPPKPEIIMEPWPHFFVDGKPELVNALPPVPADASSAEKYVIGKDTSVTRQWGNQRNPILRWAPLLHSVDLEKGTAVFYRSKPQRGLVAYKVDIEEIFEYLGHEKVGLFMGDDIDFTLGYYSTESVFIYLRAAIAHRLRQLNVIIPDFNEPA